MTINCAKPCATCPFLTDNHGKPNPLGYSPEEFSKKNNNQNYYDWYAPQNLIRLWRDGLRKGEMMICHSTDTEASEYGGKDAAPGRQMLCIGSLIIVRKHLGHIEELLKETKNLPQALKNYRLKAGKYPMTKTGVLAWIEAIIFKDLNGYPIPNEIDGSAINRVSVVWKDEIINQSEVAGDDN